MKIIIATVCILAIFIWGIMARYEREKIAFDLYNRAGIRKTETKFLSMLLINIFFCTGATAYLLGSISIWIVGCSLVVTAVIFRRPIEKHQKKLSENQMAALAIIWFVNQLIIVFPI
jgi:hypothetical protein